MLSVQEAKQIIKQVSEFSETASMPLQEIAGLTLAQDIVASVDIPNFAQSSMDGYAIIFSDKNHPIKIIGEMAAGTSSLLAIQPGQATRIFTGAPLPENADTVVMQEKVSVSANILHIKDQNLHFGQYVRQKGAEVQQGTAAMRSGTYLSPAALGFLSGIGCTHATVYLPPKVGIILTGNELQQPGKELSFGQVYEANSVQLTAALNHTGIKTVKIFSAGDDREVLAHTLSTALAACDVVLLNGGVSVGDYDFVVGAAVDCGVQALFHKIKQKPGKPLFFGKKDRKLIFGLPGNPASALTCFYEYVLPALESIMKLPAGVKSIKARVSHRYEKPLGLTQFLKAHYFEGTVTALHAQEFFRLHSFAQANCFIVLAEASNGCAPNDLVEVHLLPI